MKKYQTKEIAEGEVRLVNVTVEGETVISGGGKNTIILEDTALQKLLVNKEDIEKEPANITLLNSTTVAALQIEAATTITGQGTITHLQIGSAGQVAVAGSIETLTVTGTDNRLELTGGTIRKLIVSQTETSTAIRLREKTLIENMELYGKAQVTGAGLIGTVTINASNTVLETESAPEQITLATGITAMVNGKEYPEKIAVTTPPKATPPKKAKPNPAPKPVPPTPPSPSPDSVKEFIVQEGISVGKKMVVVKLYAADPSTYTVTVGGERLNYMASQQSFYGEVDEGSANRSSVRVSQQ